MPLKLLNGRLAVGILASPAVEKQPNKLLVEE